MREPQEIEDEEHEQVVERVAAVDVAKASGMVCTRVPHPSRPGGRRTRVGGGCHWRISGRWCRWRGMRGRRVSGMGCACGGRVYLARVDVLLGPGVGEETVTCRHCW
jgi:hypothetical protein